MSNDQTLQVAMLTVMAAVMPIAAFYRLRSFTKEPLDRWQEGAVILFGLRLGGVPLFLGMLAWLINPDWMAWSSLPLPMWLRWIGIGMGVCAGLLLLWTFHNLGRNLTDTVVTRQGATLVTSGPYRYVRHPFYLTFALGMIGAALAMANWFILLAGLIPLAFLVVRTRIEEQKLVDRFGDEYRDYMRRVGRFVPRMW